jgi:cytochrome c biogenesis protein CcmG, thiol:disulfide interchange protein DsbE
VKHHQATGLFAAVSLRYYSFDMKTLLRKFFTFGSMGCAFAILAFFALPHYRQGESSVAGKTAEDFNLELNGKPTRLSDFRGKVVVLNFWASWCKPCVEETPGLIQLQQRIAPRNGVILGVSIDEDAAAYNKFVKEQGLNYPTMLDSSAKIANDYGTFMWPETYVIDRQGKIARKIIGPQDWNSREMVAYFDNLLARN